MGCAPEASREGEGGETPQSPDSSRTVAGAEKLADCPSTPSRPPVSDGLPDVSLPCLGNGPDIRLADLRGPLLVNVWAQWCGPCRDEAPYLADLQQKSGGKVQLIGIDYADPRPEKAIEFAVEHGLVYPHLADTDKQVRQPLRVGGPPLTAFVDKAGKVVHVHRGVFKSQQELDQLVRTKLGVTW
ncbi:alkyl hydroperoxide reductase/ Thiol specific antioxidant/ Mal allergen [Kribbella flavida DSM 17836]|uniref:Alkyl hydroperoxide reductase/ Thiol specific antioxidant/ Mal allergen n=2 Tax=Kribbella flavida TaxID=182640 RepID=D2PUR1_KRIFD|nr:alkyl hydroperoxide reductase/ Thiol specific antioxidant/ Mal allergen [Kribbella flavida DSM 17836]